MRWRKLIAERKGNARERKQKEREAER